MLFLKVAVMIKLDNVTKTYDLGANVYQALRGISFEVDSGEVVAVIGPSGSGKTTTMNIIGLLDHPTTGDYFFRGQPIANLTSNQLAKLRNETIGFVFQSFHLLPRLTALQNVSLPLYYAGVDSAEIPGRAISILEKMDMAAYAKHKPNELSGGQQQRVAIARALVNQPSLILADEPTGALDTKTSQQIMDVLLANRGETTVVIITHDEDVAKQCERSVSIRDGLLQ